MVALVTLNAFEELAVSTAMPVAATDLGGVREYALAFSLFITTSLLGTVITGGWADASGPRLPLVVGLVSFGAGLLVCGLAPNFNVLLAGRAIAGFGAGMQIVAVYVVVSDTFPLEQHSKIFAWLSAAWVLPAIIGPTIAGWVAVTFTWRLVFLAVPPLAVMAWLVMLRGMATMRGLPDAEATLPAPDDPLSEARSEARSEALSEAPVERPAGEPVGETLLSAPRRAAYGLGVAFGALLMQWGSQHVKQLAGLPVAAAGLVVMGLTVPRLLPDGALKLRVGLPSVVVTRGLLTASFYAAETFIPLLLVTGRGLSPARAGLVLTGGALGWASGSWLLSQPWLHWAQRRVLVTGAIVLSIGIVGLVSVGRDWVSPYAVLGIWLIAAIGMGLAFTATSVLALLFAPEGEEGRASSSLQLCDGLGGVLGLGIAGAAFAATHTPGGNDGPTLGWIWAALAVVALGAAFTGARSRLVA